MGRGEQQASTQEGSAAKIYDRLVEDVNNLRFQVGGGCRASMEAGVLGVRWFELEGGKYRGNTEHCGRFEEAPLRFEVASLSPCSLPPPRR